jgi:hypothetical protein
MSCKYNKQLLTRATKRLELIHSDLCGSFLTNSVVARSRYFIVFVDDATRFT